MKYSILYLNWDPEHKNCETIKESLHSVVSNSIGHDYEIIILDRPGVGKEINRGFREARGEYLIVLSNDVFIENNWLDFFGVPNTITSFLKTVSHWNPHNPEQELDCSCFCLPRNIQQQVGEWDENFKGYGYDDNDYLYRAKKLGITLEQVPIKVKHLTSMTADSYGIKRKEEMEFNHNYLLKKHNL